MSAGSPRRSRSQTRTTQGCATVSPQQVTDPTILDSVAGFINEVATYNAPSDNKDQIQWARFETLDSDAVLESLDGDKIIPVPLVLVIGYSSGIQVWAIPANGEAVELLSWRHGSVKVLRFLPSPYITGRSLTDLYASKRPLMALCDSTTPGPQHCVLNFLSLRTGEQVKVIKFKNPVLDVLANRRSVVVTFAERIAVFDAFTFDDRLTVTTCYLSPGIYQNPVALGSRWMAYAEKNLISNKRSGGGNEGEGVQSYTATVIHAAKSLGKGLRELGETVASSLTGNPSFKPGTSPGNFQPVGAINQADSLQKGVITVLDIENQIQDDKNLQTEGVVAHFAAHSEAVVCLAFDPSGLLLLTADKRGHDFHLFRIHPHPGGSALAVLHHLYVLHRGDTTARVQDMAFSPDSRWVAVSTLRGTTHVFPITPYGGNVGVRTHATPHVVNRMSRFHRSAGLPVEGRSNSPVSLLDVPVSSHLPYNNPRLPPYPHPTIVQPLAQIRQPLFIQAVTGGQQRSHTGRQRLNSSSEDNIQIALRLSSCFAPARAWFDTLTQTHDTSLTKQQAKPVESLFIMSCHGTLVQYDLDPHHTNSIPKEKVCDETPIELTVHAKAQWVLQRQLHLNDVPLPVSPKNLNLLPQDIPLYKTSKPNHTDDRWLSQVEIVTHAGPHRRLWMGPQFTFKTYTTTNGSLALHEAQAIDVGRSKPVNMPVSTTYPILIESGSTSSCEQSPKLLDTYRRLSAEVGGAGELQLKEDLADAMLESPGVRDTGGRCVIVSLKPHTAAVAKVVNPLGTVVTVHSDDDVEVEPPEDAIIHENCDEALFRPVVAPKPILFTENKPRILNKPLPKHSVPEIVTVKTKPTKENVKEEKTSKTKPDLKPTEPVKNTEQIKVKPETPKEPLEPPKIKIQNKNNKSENKYHNKSEIKIDISLPKIEDPLPPPPVATKKSKSKGKSYAFATETTLSVDNSLKKTTETSLKPEPNNKKLDTFSTLITTPDLMDTIDTLEFPLDLKFKKKDKPKDEDVFDFPLLFSNKNEEVLKEEKFEDARDTAETCEMYSSFKVDSPLQKDTNKSYKSGKYQGLEPDEIVFSSEEEKCATKKPRKPKAKLGVRLSKGKEAEKENEVEIILPPPKKTWSSIVSSKPSREMETENSILDLPEIETVDFTLELPKKSYSTAMKEHLFEIDPHEDLGDSNILVPEKTCKLNISSETADDYNLLKIESKSSDDEKQENGSSQTETTESDDSTSKIIAMDTEEDGCQTEVNKKLQNGPEKTTKRKSKKKKR